MPSDLTPEVLERLAELNRIYEDGLSMDEIIRRRSIAWDRVKPYLPALLDAAKREQAMLAVCRATEKERKSRVIVGVGMSHIYAKTELYKALDALPDSVKEMMMDTAEKEAGNAD